jgi:hypothetical protein
MAAQKKSQIASEQPQSATKRRGGCGDGWLAASTQEKAGIRGRVGLQHLHETRLRARAPKGKRAYGKVPRNLKARTPRSDRLDHPPRRYGRVDDPREGATDAAAFEAYVQHFLAPSLCEGQVVVLDGLGAHRTQKVRELIQARGADLVLLPSYSPDLNPIEICQPQCTFRHKLSYPWPPRAARAPGAGREAPSRPYTRRRGGSAMSSRGAVPPRP